VNAWPEKEEGVGPSINIEGQFRVQLFGAARTTRRSSPRADSARNLGLHALESFWVKATVELYGRMSLLRYGASGGFASKPFPSYQCLNDPTLTENGNGHEVPLGGSPLLELPLESLQPSFEVHCVVISREL
jgi:hypothetical protein